MANGQISTGNTVRMTSWIGFTLSGIVGFATALVAVTLTFADVRHTATAAAKASTLNRTSLEVDVRPRLRSLEEWRAEERVALKAIRDQNANANARLDSLVEAVNALTAEVRALRGR